MSVGHLFDKKGFDQIVTFYKHDRKRNETSLFQDQYPSKNKYESTWILTLKEKQSKIDPILLG